MISKKSHNESILNYLIRKGRRLPSSPDAGYFILYAFLYKYLSDKLKNHLLYSFGGDGDDLKFFYLSDTSDIKEIALNDLGYFFENHEAYLDNVVKGRFIDEMIPLESLMHLKDSIVFSPNNPSEEYFNTIIRILEEQNFDSDHNSEENQLISNFVISIADLDLNEEKFSFKRVYDSVASLRQIRLTPTPEYIPQILERITVSSKYDAENIYDPFLRDASILFNISKDYGLSQLYAKEENKLYYFYSLIKAFIYEFDFENVFLAHESAIESMAFDDELFDIIVSKIPNDFKYVSRSYKNQNLEAPNLNKVDIKEQLISKYDLSKLGEDEELLKALSIVEKKVEAVEKSNILDFDEEFATLVDSEFLFVINMVNSLKENGIMAISVSQNFLFKNSLTLLRKFLTYKNNYIDTIISLPEGLSRSIRPEVIIVFKKDRTFDDILFIDISKDFNVIPSKNRIPGGFRRSYVLSDKTLDKIIDVFKNRKTIDKFSKVVSLRELENNEYNLTVSRYVDTFEGEFIRLKDLKPRKKEIDSKMDELSKKIDLMMDELENNNP